jgi:hypothetical protein
MPPKIGGNADSLPKVGNTVKHVVRQFVDDLGACHGRASRNENLGMYRRGQQLAKRQADHSRRIAAGQPVLHGAVSHDHFESMEQFVESSSRPLMVRPGRKQCGDQLAVLLETAVQDLDMQARHLVEGAEAQYFSRRDGRIQPDSPARLVT